MTRLTAINATPQCHNHFSRAGDPSGFVRSGVAGTGLGKGMASAVPIVTGKDSGFSPRGTLFALLRERSCSNNGTASNAASSTDVETYLSPQAKSPAQYVYRA